MKRIFIIAFVAIMALTVFVGCSNKKDNIQPTQKPTVTSTIRQNTTKKQTTTSKAGEDLSKAGDEAMSRADKVGDDLGEGVDKIANGVGGSVDKAGDAVKDALD